MTTALREEDVIARLRAACVAAGGQTAWAAANGVSVPYVHDVCRGRRGPGDSVLRGLGLQREVRYVAREPETVALHDADGVTLLVAESLP